MEIEAVAHVERKVYHNSEEHKRVSFAQYKAGSSASFEMDGYRWNHGGNGVDDIGSYDLIYRTLSTAIDRDDMMQMLGIKEPQPAPDMSILRSNLNNLCEAYMAGELVDSIDAHGNRYASEWLDSFIHDIKETILTK